MSGGASDRELALVWQLIGQVSRPLLVSTAIRVNLEVESMRAIGMIAVRGN